MFTKKTARVLSVVAPAALTIALAAPAFAQKDQPQWSAMGKEAWVNSAGECWQSIDGPKNLPPCAKKAIIDSYTINLVNDEFDFDKYFLKPDMKVALDDLARRVKASEGNEMLTIVGHTDSKGTEQYNYGLGQRRADATREYLIKVGGLDPARIRTESDGEGNPVASNETDSGRAQNRRIEVKASE